MPCAPSSSACSSRSPSRRARRRGRPSESLIQDDLQLLQSGAAARERALDDVAALGADGVRALALWRSIAPAQPPAGLRRRPIRPTTRRGAGTRSTASSAGSPRAAWTCCSPPRCRCRRGPRAASATAACASPTRSSTAASCARWAPATPGPTADENEGRGVLPRVERWSFSNEPNQPAWLRPQFARRDGVVYAAAARALPLAGPRGHRRPAGDRPRRRRDAARRDGPDRPHDRARSPRGRSPRSRSCARCCASDRARGAAAAADAAARAPGGCASRASPTTRTPAAARGRPAARATRRRRSPSPPPAGSSGCSTPRPTRAGCRTTCRSTTRSTASRPIRPTASSGSRSPARRSTSTRPTGSRSATRGSARSRSTS